MQDSMYSPSMIFSLNERLFNNCLAGVTDAMAAERISDHNNPLVWLAVHTTWARYNIASLLGQPTKNPYNGLFENSKPFDSSMVFDSIEKVKAEWVLASALLKEGLATVTAEHLTTPAPFKNPKGDNTMLGAIIFLAQHESYDIGQMALLKKYLTKEAMSYS
jgi:hypothetical protein